MGLKKDELKAANQGEGCLGKAAPDEPVFILRGQDATAPELVELWATRMAQRLGSEGYKHPKVVEAQELAAKMRAWPNRKFPD